VSTARDDLDDDLTRIGDLVPGPPLTIGETATVADARRLLVQYRVPAIAVLGDRDELRGIVTRTDVLGADDLTAPIAGVMSMYLVAVRPGASILRAAALLACENIGQVIVIGADGSLLGIVGAADIARYFAMSAGSQVANP
jgi:IMP dehydrogenase